MNTFFPRFALGIFLLISNSSLAADETKQVPVDTFLSSASCVEATQSIRIEDTDSSLLISIPNLARVPNLGWLGVCSLFLRELRERTSSDADITSRPFILQRVVSPSARDNQQWRSAELDSLCVDVGYCLRDLFDFWSLSPDLKRCSRRLDLLELPAVAGRSAPPELTPLSNITTAIFPIESLAGLLEREATREGGNIVAASMSVGDGTARRLHTFFTSRTSGAMLAVDAPVLFTNMSTTAREELCSDSKMSIIPISRGLSHTGHFHWKGFSAVGSSRGTISAMNLSSPERNPFLDVLFSFEQPQAAAELRSIFMQRLASQCRYPEEISCIAQAFGVSESNCSSALRRGCQNIIAFSESPERRSINHFLDTSRYDPVLFLTREFNRAQREIVVAVYELTDKRVIAALLAAQARGVRILVLLGNRSLELDRVPAIWSKTWDSHSSLPKPHMKISVIDNERIIFSTANYTPTALDHSDELFAIITERKVIDSISSLLRSYGVPTSTGAYPTHFALSARSSIDLAEFLTHSPQLIDRSRTGGANGVVPLTEYGNNFLKNCRVSQMIIAPKALRACLATGSQ